MWLVTVCTEMPRQLPIFRYVHPADSNRSTSTSLDVSMARSSVRSVTDVELVARAVREEARARALRRRAHLVVAAHERAGRAVGARHALAIFGGYPRRLSRQRLAVVVELEAALAGHHVGHRARHHPGLGGDVVRRIEPRVQHFRHARL